MMSGMENAPNAQCTISTEGEGGGEIRTKVFRIGAPLLRSTIPVSLGMGRGGYKACPDLPVAPQPCEPEKTKKSKGKAGDEEGDGSDVETILSLSDADQEDLGQLSVTLDFPC